jgi:putative hemolysin
MAALDFEAKMRIDASTDPKLISADLCERQKIGWRPEWITRHFSAGRDFSPSQRPRPSLGAIGPLEIGLARNKQDVKRVQKLRYEVFYEHGAAVADVLSRLTRRDLDDFDSICDHLMVVDRSRLQSLSGESPVVGTYRLLAQEVAAANSGFYSASEFDISGLLERHAGQRFLELGRACVLPAYRSRRAIELLWRGIWRYVREHRVDVMIGCASFEGTNSELFARPLSLLHHFALAPEPWRASAHSSRRVEMNMMGRSDIDIRCAWRELPSLIKGYLRAGAYVGDGAVIDRRFGTIDVLIVLPVATISPRYIRHFGADARRHSAGRDSSPIALAPASASPYR